ncbi:serine hydrolase domain-containing protein [Novosphingobium olei]|uniref:Beta-lactamase family protein n=1 Tax=Novosphingobium olei TaxID=2728851 RepID=A0A7Y0BQM0_9SPHN|nr:serine hydrolase domain-containing protein [Novosphingobium olei]NML94709.1 beta-lactamase family protein [Novosphingobium olei]BEV02302.1 serine hydrolase [Novosphingobium olei]
MKGEAEFEAALAAANLPGAVALITDSKDTRYLRAFGMADAVAGVPMREDSLFQIASMTKALTSAAVLQLVERGKLDLDAPVGAILPELADPQVLDGFDEAGAPILRPAKSPVTLRHLLMHTSGCGYTFMNADLLRHAMATGNMAPGTRKSLDQPLAFDPGTRWEYGTGIDWAGLAVEAVTGMRLGEWFERELTGPLGMTQTRFRDSWSADDAQIHVRSESGELTTQAMVLGAGEYHNGGGGLSSTASDYARFLRMVLRGGELDGVRVLSPESAQAARTDALAPHLSAGEMATAMPGFATAFDPLPGQRGGWTIGGFLVNTETGPAGRSPGSLHWAGIFNCYYWIDPDRDLAGVILTQMSPFAEPGALDAFAALERMACANA